MTRGSGRARGDHLYARARYGRGKRLELRVPWARTKAEADERGRIIADVAQQLVAIGRRDLVRGTARELANADTPARLAKVLKAAKAIVAGMSVAPSHDITFEQWAERYTSGELARLYPDRVRARDHKNDISRLREYILPHVADVPVIAFDLGHAEKVLGKLPPMSEANRRQIAQVMGRLMHLAVLPGRLIAASPLPRGWLPKVTKRRHYSCLYPREEAMLLADARTSEAFRLFCGLLNREGMRLSELLDAEWWQFNLEEGTFQTTRTKTGDPRMWAMRADSTAALRVWKERTPADAKPFAYVLALVKGDRTKLAGRFRQALRDAGITRAELFTSTEHTARLRVHDLRATFVTISLAEGRPDTWIRDRTAHKSTSMIDRYRRTARQVAELRLGSLVDLVEGLGWGKGGGKTASDGGDGVGVTAEKCTGRESNPHALRRWNLNALSASEATPDHPKTPGEDDVARTLETAFPHPSPTPLATSRAVAGGSSSESSERSTLAPSNDGRHIEPKPGPARAGRREDARAAAETLRTLRRAAKAVGDDFDLLDQELARFGGGRPGR